MVPVNPQIAYCCMEGVLEPGLRRFIPPLPTYRTRKCISPRVYRNGLVRVWATHVIQNSHVFAICPNGAPTTTVAQQILTILPDGVASSQPLTVTGTLYTDGIAIGTTAPQGCFQVAGSKLNISPTGGVQLGRDQARHGLRR